MLPFIARGHTPGWQLKLEKKSMRFRANYGQTDIKVSLPIARPTNRGNFYKTARLTVEITSTTCSDRMSLDRYSEMVTVIADGREFQGCGGMKLQTGSLNGTDWTIISMDRMPVLEDVNTHLSFDNGYVTIRSVCGRAGGDFSQNGHVLKFRYLTPPPRRTCSTYQTAHEAKVAAFLRAELAIRYSTEGHLVLTNENGTEAIMKRVL